MAGYCEVRSWLGWGCCLVAAVACAPTTARVGHPEGPAPMEGLDVRYKRVDEWQFTDLKAAPTAVEIQLKRHLERTHASAQYSRAYTCVARELANFYEKHTAFPDNGLDFEILERCNAPEPGQIDFRVYYSDGTLLDKPLSDADLNDISQKLGQSFEPFTTFGITARALGPNMLVMFTAASPRATMHIDEPDSDRNVLVTGELLVDVDDLYVLINQGQSDVATCEADDSVERPKYAFSCPLAVGDDEASVSLSANSKDGWEVPLLILAAHDSDWTAKTHYRHTPHQLPEDVGTAPALIAVINSLRTANGKPPLEHAREQSEHIASVYQRLAKTDADQTQPLSAQMLRGEQIRGDVSWARMATGSVYDGDAGDWLDWQLRYPLARATLMADQVQQIAITTHADPEGGYALAAVVYQLLTPEGDEKLRTELATAVKEHRGKHPTELLDSSPTLEAMAVEVSHSDEPETALRKAVLRTNLTQRGDRYLDAALVPLDAAAFEHLPELFDDAKKLSYGIIVVHLPEPTLGWFVPTALVWFHTDRPPGQTAQLF